jgi:TRAP transporter 4TM/12TM fusion protein
MLPPVMGAVAFIMSDITNIPYADIVAASWLPSILYYVAIYILVHNDAVRNREPPMPADQIVPLHVAIATGWRHLLPIGAMMWLLLAGYTPVYVAAGSTAAVIVLSWFHPRSAIGPRRFVECCTETITQVVPLVGAVAAAGAVIGAIEISALAGKFTLVINTLSGGMLVPALLLSAVFLILLGMGMPTPAVYIMGAALLAPILRQFNLPEFQVHLFMLFYACLSAITPPVAVANFAAAAIAGVNPTSLGPYAVKLAIGGFVVPFFFLFNPGLTVHGTLGDIVLDCILGTVCTVCASFALHGMLGLKDLGWALRAVLAACTIALIVPRLEIQLTAALVGVLVLVFSYLRKVDVPAR